MYKQRDELGVLGAGWGRADMTSCREKVSRYGKFLTTELTRLTPTSKMSSPEESPKIARGIDDFRKPPRR